MNRDPQGSRRVDEAVRALREEGDAAAPQAKLTRERILRDLRPRPRSRRWVWAVPVAALLAGSTVLAATGRLPVILQTVGETAARVFGGSKHVPPRESTPRVATPAASAPAVPVEPAPAVAPSTETPPAQVEPAPPPHAEPSVRRHARSADAGTKGVAPPATPEVTAPSASAAPEVTTPPASAAPAETLPKATEADETLALYRRAHRLHFVEQNPSAALAAWNDYLAKNPKGPLVVDALYDRALCLVRLGRPAEARTALEPFADGRYGSYRQKDAKALLEALKAQ
jgi:hypothetical protein